MIYAIGLHVDLFADLAAAAVSRRFVGLNESADALGLAGRERRIRRGPTEPDANYAARLLPWLDDHKIRGGPYALLEQVWAYRESRQVRPVLTLDDGVTVLTGDDGLPLLGPLPDLVLQYESGARFTRHDDGSVDRAIVGNYDTNITAWARWWLIIQWPEALSSEGIWAEPGTWDDGGVWDSGVSGEDVADLRLVPSEWNSGHTLGYIKLTSPGEELWDTPSGLWSDPGVWGDASQPTVTISVE